MHFSQFSLLTSRIWASLFSKGFPGKDEIWDLQSMQEKDNPFQRGYQPLVLNSANDGRFDMQSSKRRSLGSYSSSAATATSCRQSTTSDQQPPPARQLDIGQQATTLRPLDNHIGPSTPTSNSVNHDPGTRLSPHGSVSWLDPLPLFRGFYSVSFHL